MKTVSILTMHRIKNYGSVLQAYALKTILEKLNCDVDFIDVICKNNINKNISKKRLNILKNINKDIIKKIKFKQVEKDFNKKILHFQEQNLQLGKTYKYNTTSNYVIIGSDEVFNCDPNCAWGVSDQLFGNIDGAQNISSYAASCGYTTIDDISESDKKRLKKYINRMKNISVRDKNTFEFIKCLSGKEAEIHLDPVLIYSFDDEVEKISHPSNLPEKYILVYSYSNRIKSKDEIMEIKKFAKKKKLPTVCIQGIQTWCDKFISLSPFEVLYAFKNAEYIITDTFHGTIMSIKFNKKFAVLVRKSNRNKISYLIKKLQMEKQSVENIKELSLVLDKQPDYSETNKIISKEKANSINYLKKCIDLERK